MTSNIALHLGTPSLRVNSVIDSAIREFHSALYVNINDPRTTEPNQQFRVLRTSLHEDTAGNLLHLSLILASIFLFFISKEMRSSRALLSYLAALVSGFLLFCALVKWSPYNSRYQLPPFVLASPFVATVLFKSLKEKVILTIAFALLLSAVPWIFLNSTRPLMGDQNIWNRTRLDPYFNTRPELRDAFLGAAYFLKLNKCGQVGLDVGFNDWEYPFWPLLNSGANEAIRIEHVNVKNESGRISALPHFSGFSPCAIISSRADQAQELATETGAYTKEWASSPITVFVRTAPPRMP